MLLITIASVMVILSIILFLMGARIRNYDVVIFAVILLAVGAIFFAIGVVSILETNRHDRLLADCLRIFEYTKDQCEFFISIGR